MLITSAIFLLFSGIIINVGSSEKFDPKDWKRVDVQHYRFMVPKEMNYAYTTQDHESRSYLFTNKDQAVELSISKPGFDVQRDRLYKKQLYKNERTKLRNKNIKVLRAEKTQMSYRVYCQTSDDAFFITEVKATPRHWVRHTFHFKGDYQKNKIKGQAILNNLMCVY